MHNTEIVAHHTKIVNKSKNGKMVAFCSLNKVQCCGTNKQRKIICNKLYFLEDERMEKTFAAFLVGAMLFTMTGCGDMGGALSDVGDELKADGREHGQTYELEQNQNMKTAFFDLNINSVQIAETFEDYLPNDDIRQFLIVNVTIKNTFEDSASIPMFYDDFGLSWEILGDDTIYPEEKFAEDQLPDEYEIYKTEQRTGNIIYEVPADITEFDFKYYEVYEDDFEGNTFVMKIKLGETEI